LAPRTLESFVALRPKGLRAWFDSLHPLRTLAVCVGARDRRTVAPSEPVEKAIDAFVGGAGLVFPRFLVGRLFCGVLAA